jgi:transketolase
MKTELDLKALKRRVIDISFHHRLSHLGSCLTALPILKHIYETKLPDEKVVLSAGHSALALYVLLEHLYGHDAEELLESMGIHQERRVEKDIHVSGGSLGKGILIAAGMCLADRRKDVHCVVSDGELAESSCWEAMAFAYKEKLFNLKLHVNMNGFAAFETVDTEYLTRRLKAFYPTVEIHSTNSNYLPFSSGLDSHYKVMDEEGYKQMLDYHCK